MFYYESTNLLVRVCPGLLIPLLAIVLVTRGVSERAVSNNFDNKNLSSLEHRAFMQTFGDMMRGSVPEDDEDSKRSTDLTDSLFGSTGAL